MITTILFDVDGVLIDSFEANLKFMQELLLKAGYTPPTRKEYIPLFQTTMMNVIKTVTRSTNPEEINRIMNMGKEERPAMYSYDLIKSPKNMKKIIQQLHKHYTLGIVTSRLKQYIFDIHQLQPLEDYFKVVVGFEDTELHKPNPEPLLFAMKKLNVTPKETIYIGDQQADFLSAMNAKTSIIILSKTPFTKATACISSFNDILTTISSIR